jgi:hypothetical protein
VALAKETFLGIKKSVIYIWLSQRHLTVRLNNSRSDSVNRWRWLWCILGCILRRILRLKLAKNIGHRRKLILICWRSVLWVILRLRPWESIGIICWLSLPKHRLFDNFYLNYSFLFLKWAEITNLKKNTKRKISQIFRMILLLPRKIVYRLDNISFKSKGQINRYLTKLLNYQFIVGSANLPCILLQIIWFDG